MGFRKPTRESRRLGQAPSGWRADADRRRFPDEPNDRARSARRADRRAVRPRLHRRRSDRTRRRDRLRGARLPPPSCRSAGRTSRTAVATGSSAATTKRASATRSGRPPGSASCSRRACGSGRRRRRGDGLEVEEEPVEPRPLAFIGVRACELAAIAIQDRVFLGGRYADRDYAARRENAFLVAVNCHEPGGTCFCVSMDTGPTARERLRPRAHRAVRGRAPVPRRGGQARGRGDPRPSSAASRRPRTISPRRRPRPRTRPAGWAASSTRTTSATCFATTSSTRAGTRSRSAA